MRLAKITPPITALLFCTALALGCGGDSSGPDNSGNQGGEFYVRFRANGTQEVFNLPNNVLTTFDKIGSEFHFGTAGVAANGNSISLAIFDVVAITTASYAGFTTVNSSGGYRLAQILYTVGGVQYENTDANQDHRITITEITPTTVKGTFSGTVKATGRASISITNGEFLSRRIN
jgi:hypothetical protein